MTTEQQQHHEGGDEIPAGFYRAKGVLGSEQAGITSNGNDQLGIDLLLLDLNRTVTTVLVFTDKSERFAIDRLRALGWTGGDSMAGIDQNEVQVQIKYDVVAGQDGTPRRVMKAEIVTGGGRFKFDKPMDEQQKRGFFARLNQLAGSAAAPSNGTGGYPANWDTVGSGGGAPAAGPPRVKL